MNLDQVSPRFQTSVLPTIASKEPDRQAIAADIAAFLAAGGQIRHIPAGVGISVQESVNYSWMTDKTVLK